MLLLDTNVLSEIVRPAPDARVVAALRKWQAGDLHASAISRYELRYGASLRRDADRFWMQLQRVVLPVVGHWLPLTVEVAERGGDICAGLRRMGRDAGDLDPLIAATALVHDLILVTRNVRHFQNIEGLRVENWFADT